MIIKSDSDIDTLNAISVVSGFRNLWVLQFETEEDTATAYKYYCSLDYIEFVETDSVVTVSDTETVTTTTSQKDYLSCFDTVNLHHEVYILPVENYAYNMELRIFSVWEILRL